MTTTVAELIEFLKKFPDDTRIEVSMGHYMDDLYLPVEMKPNGYPELYEGDFEATYWSATGFEYDPPQVAHPAVPPSAGTPGMYLPHDGFPARDRVPGTIRFGCESGD